MVRTCQQPCLMHAWKAFLGRRAQTKAAPPDGVVRRKSFVESITPAERLDPFMVQIDHFRNLTHSSWGARSVRKLFSGFEVSS